MLIGIWENIGVPGYGWAGVGVFLFVYGSLSIAIFIAARAKSHETLCLALGGLPLLFLNTLYVIFSDPFHLPPLALALVAVLWSSGAVTFRESS